MRAGMVVSEGKNVVEGNWVLLRAEESIAQTGTKSAKKLGLAAGWKVDSECRGAVGWCRHQRRSLRKFGSEPNTYCFRQDLNCEWTGSL